VKRWCNDEPRFWARVDRRGPNDCWLWTRSVNSSGYGQMQYSGRVRRTHQLAWSFVNGPIPPGLQVLHRCDNPPCCNPAHLFLGTHADNMRDMAQKGRAARAQSPLTSEQVREIQALAHAGLGRREIAGRFGVHPDTVSKISRGRAWKPLTEEPAAAAPLRQPLSTDSIAEIRRLLSAGLSRSEIARRFGVNPTTVGRIRMGRIGAAA